MAAKQPQALLISAPASSQGKTSMTAGIARSLARAGKRVRVFKIGPDFLDPMILESAAGTPVRQVDLWLMGEDECRRALLDASRDADVLLVEGALGLFDGEPSTADFAEKFQFPIALVVDVRGMAQTVQALVHGLSTYRPGLDVVGFLANNVGSPRHELMLSGPAEGDSTGSTDSRVPFLGAVFRAQDMSLPSRHLGLHQSVEINELDQILDRIAGAIESTGIQGAFRSWQGGAASECSSTSTGTDGRVDAIDGLRIGVAEDECFSFLYHRNIEFLEEHGATVQFFSPLHDSSIPDCDALYLPGGYPELHAEALSQNVGMLESLRAHVKRSRKVYAECGGMMFLLDGIVSADGETVPMAGVLPGRALMGKRLAALGYQSLVIGGEVARGHTFHYSQMETSLKPFARATQRLTGQPGEMVFQHGSIVASYLHLYFPSAPEFVLSCLSPDRFVAGYDLGKPSCIAPTNDSVLTPIWAPIRVSLECGTTGGAEVGRKK